MKLFSSLLLFCVLLSITFCVNEAFIARMRPRGCSRSTHAATETSKGDGVAVAVAVGKQAQQGGAKFAYQDSWDRELLAALGYDDAEVDSSIPVISHAESMAVYEARHYIRKHMGEVLRALVRELDRKYRARFGSDAPPLQWKSIRKAVAAKRLDASGDKKAEATRVFLRNGFKAKLEALGIPEQKFMDAIDVQTPDWAIKELSSSIDDNGQRLSEEDRFPTMSNQQLLLRLDSLVMPEALRAKFSDAKEVIAKSLCVLQEAEERRDKAQLAREAAGKPKPKREVEKRKSNSYSPLRIGDSSPSPRRLDTPPPSSPQ